MVRDAHDIPVCAGAAPCALWYIGIGRRGHPRRDRPTGISLIA